MSGMRIADRRFCTFPLLLVLLATQAFAQSSAVSPEPKPGKDGTYEVELSELKRLDSSPRIEVPRELSPYEFTDEVSVVFTISHDGKVTQAKSTSGRTATLKDYVEKTVKRWTFQPYTINGAPVAVRSTAVFKFQNTLNGYRDADGDRPVFLYEATTRPMITKKVIPNYPADARIARISGIVELRVIVNKRGEVERLRILKGHPMLVGSAYNAVREWKFKPYEVDGKVLPYETIVTVTYELSG